MRGSADCSRVQTPFGKDTPPDSGGQTFRAPRVLRRWGFPLGRPKSADS